MPLRLPVALVVLALSVGGCDGTVDDAFTPQLVVSAQLGANEPLADVRLSRTVALGEVYTPEGAAVEGASVSVSLLRPDGTAEAVYPYAPSWPGPPGVYVQSGDRANVSTLPGRTYRLDVIGPDGERLTATTTVPPAFDVVEPPDHEVLYGLGQGPEIRITQTSTATRQAAFVGSTRALAPDAFTAVTVDGATRYRSQNLPDRFRPVPIVQRFFDCVEEGGGTLLCEDDPSVDAVVGTSPVINEGSYIDLGDGTILVQIPFLAFGFYGPQSVTLVSLDPALQAFVQTQIVQGGGSTLSPGEIPNVTTNVEGGLGVFGSFARQTVTTTIVPAGAP